MRPSNPDQIRAFASVGEFRDWLALHHTSASELWLRFARKTSLEVTISKLDAVREALCWGWIDGQLAHYDEVSFLTRFSPRRAGSAWSRVNRDHAEALIAKGRMQLAGLAQVTAAQVDGRWDAAYAAQSTMQVPDDFIDALEDRPGARDTYLTLNRANVFAIVYRLETAKTPETRAKRMAAILDMLARGERFH